MSRTQHTTKKTANYTKLLDYMSNPKNPILTRRDMSTQVLGYKREHTIYAYFSPAELSELEWEALKIRRTRYAGEMAKVDCGVLKKAQKGNAAEATLAYQKFEDWSKKSTVEVGVNMQVLEVIFNVLPGEYVEKIKDVLASLSPSNPK